MVIDSAYRPARYRVTPSVLTQTGSQGLNSTARRASASARSRSRAGSGPVASSQARAVQTSDSHFGNRRWSGVELERGLPVIDRRLFLSQFQMDDSPNGPERGRRVAAGESHS